MSASVRPDVEGRDESESVVAPTVSPETSSGARAVSFLHDFVGNQVLGSALEGDAFGGIGWALADEVTGAVGGLEGPGAIGSNQAMARLLRKATEALDTETAWRDIAASSGRALDATHRERLELAFDHDFAHVRVHVDGAAQRAAETLSAHAFALGADIYFGPNEFAPGTQRGDRLLAHELTHVVQHDQGRLGGGEGVSSPSDPTEREAYANESRILRQLDIVDRQGPEALEVAQATAPELAAPTPATAVEATPSVEPSVAGDDVGAPELSVSRRAVGPEASSDVPEAVARRVAATLGAPLGQGGLFSEGMKVGRVGTEGRRDPNGAESLLLGLAGADEDHAGGQARAFGVARRSGVVDEDAGRRALTLALLARLAPKVGLPAGRVEVRVDDEARRVTERLGDRGVVRDGVIYLNPDAYDPATRSGQSLLAHEVVHVAQEGVAPNDFAEGLHAEAEAALFAKAFVSGQTTEAPIVPMADGHVAREGGPGAADIEALMASYRDMATMRRDAAQAAADTQQSQVPDSDRDRPDEKERDEVEEFEDGLEASIDELEDTDTFEDMADAIDSGDAISTYLGRFSRNEHYDNAVEMYKGALKHETKSSEMLSVWNSEWDRDTLMGNASWREAYRQLRRKAENDARIRLAEEQALAELEKAKQHQEPGPTDVQDNPGQDPGQGSPNAADLAGGQSPSETVPTPVTQLPPPAPNYDLAEQRHSDTWPAVEREYSHYSRYNAGIQEQAGDKWARIGPVATEFFGGFLGGLGSGFVDGLKEKFLTDVVGGGLDRMLQSSPRFGGAMRGVPFFTSGIKLAQMGMSGDLGNIATLNWSETARGKKIGEAWEGMGAAIDGYSHCDDWTDYVGVTLKLLCDVLQFVAEILGFIVDLLNIIEAICWILGGLFIIIGIVFSWWGLAFLVPWGLNLCRVARLIKKVTDVLSPIVDALSFIVAFLRPLSAILVPAELYGQELAGTGAAGEFFGEKSGGAIADDVATRAQEAASTPPPPPQTDTTNPTQETQQQGQQQGDTNTQQLSADADAQVNQMRDATNQIEGELNTPPPDPAQQQADANVRPGEPGGEGPDPNRQQQPGGEDPARRPDQDGPPPNQPPAGNKPGDRFNPFRLAWKGIMDARPSQKLGEVRTKWRDLTHTFRDIAGTRFSEQATVRETQVAEARAQRDAAIEQMKADNAQGAEVLAQMRDAEVALRDAKFRDADPAEITRLQGQVDQLRNQHAATAQAFDTLNRAVADAEANLQSVRDLERADVQGGIRNQMKDEEEQRKRRQQLETELETKRQRKTEAESQATELDEKARDHEERATQVEEYERRQAEVEDLERTKGQHEDDAARLSREADAVAHVEELDRQSQAQKTLASLAQRDADGLRRELVGQQVQVGGEEGGLEIREVHPDGVVTGPDGRRVAWEDIEGPPAVTEKGETFREQIEQAETAREQADDLERQANEQKMAMAEDRRWTGQSAAEIRAQADSQRAEAGDVNQQIEDARALLGENPSPDATAAELREKAAEFRNSANLQRDAAHELDQQITQGDTELQGLAGPQGRMTAGDRAKSIGGMTAAHDAGTSERGNAPKSAKSGPDSGLGKWYLDNFVRGGNSAWIKLLGKIMSPLFDPPAQSPTEALATAANATAISNAAAGTAPVTPEVVGLATNALGAAGPADPSTGKVILDWATDTGGQVKNLLYSGFGNVGLARANADLIPKSAGGKAPDPPMSTEDLQAKFDDARFHMEENAYYHAWAYRSYLAEVIALDKSVEAEELADTVGQAVLDRANAHRDPLQQGAADEQRRQAGLQQGEPDTRPADPGMGGWLGTIIEAIMEGGDEVDDAPDMNNADPSQAQDNADETATKSHEEGQAASDEQAAHMDALLTAQSDLVTSVSDDQTAVQNKSQEDFATSQRIRESKEQHLSLAAEHYAAGESSAMEFNTGLDQMVVWAADWKGRREKAGVGLDQDRENAGWANDLLGIGSTAPQALMQQQQQQGNA